MCSDRCIDDDWLIRRYNSTTSYDTGHLMSGDIIALFHISTNKPALYSTNIQFNMQFIWLNKVLTFLFIIILLVAY
jgi:hypothetical protein